MQPRRQQLVKPPCMGGQYIPRTILTDDDNQLYFRECNKLYYTAFCIKSQFDDLLRFSYQLKQKVSASEKNLDDIKKSSHASEAPDEQKPKRFRRTNQMINKPFKCNEQKCDKVYASEGSLQQHIKLKHERHGLQRRRSASKSSKEFEESGESSCQEGKQKRPSDAGRSN